MPSATLTGDALKTFQIEQKRAIAVGILETSMFTFLLLIAVKHFDAPPMARALLATGGTAGHLLSPLVVYSVSQLQIRAAHAASGFALLGAVGFLIASLSTDLVLYVCGALLGLVSAASTVPMFTQIYRENYPSDQRGTLFSRTARIRIVTACLAGLVFGSFLDHDITQYPIVLLIFGASLLFGSFITFSCPSKPLNQSAGSSPFRAFRFIKTDPAFRLVLISSMFMGAGNLMMMPFRVDYIANDDFGYGYSALYVTLVTGILPYCTRFLMSPVWGGLFDRMNFFVLRVFINCFFVVAVATFFLTPFLSQTLFGSPFPSFVIGALILGIAMAGGEIAWSLWVTKLAPPEHVADYMSIHTCFTGIRGVIAPMLAYMFLPQVGVQGLALVAISMILFGSVMLYPELRSWKRRRPGRPIVDQYNE